ncbi:hypothetical protein PMAYCL1PPCAC_13794, partial [Pristionchus mayeri]
SSIDKLFLDDPILNDTTAPLILSIASHTEIFNCFLSGHPIQPLSSKTWDPCPHRCSPSMVFILNVLPPPHASASRNHSGKTTLTRIFQMVPSTGFSMDPRVRKLQRLL